MHKPEMAVVSSTSHVASSILSLSAPLVWQPFCDSSRQMQHTKLEVGRRTKVTASQSAEKHFFYSMAMDSGRLRIGRIGTILACCMSGSSCHLRIGFHTIVVAHQSYNYRHRRILIIDLSIVSLCSYNYHYHYQYCQC